MRKKIGFLCLIVSFCFSQSALSFGRMGHDAVAYIAECNLTHKAKKNIAKYLDRSIVYYASWMDEYRATPTYRHTNGWHTAAVDRNLQYTDAVRKSGGDAVCELENAIEMLKGYRNLDDSTVAVNIKYVIHLVGDMHCPTHVKYPDIKMSYTIKLNGKAYSYHSVWDTHVIESAHRWGYMEWQHQMDRCSKKEKKAIVAGTPRDWFHENAVNCRVIYDMATADSEQGKDFLNAAHPLAESQILKAGYRLAAILNELFG